MKKIAVVLSGCGFKDGSEITEAVSSLIALSAEGASYQCFAPDTEFKTTNHINDNGGQSRNVLTESARICRGDIQDIKKLSEADYDALLFPGGYGAALNLCNWAKHGSKCDVNKDVEISIQNFYKASKPIGAICIAPALIARVLGQENITVTIGNDKETAQEIEKTGAQHEDCQVDDFITDRAHKIITTPAYMYGDAKPNMVFTGISKLVKELVEMA